MSPKTALVTGAARGIGLATAKLFLQDGWRVAMVDRDAEALTQATAGLDGAYWPSSPTFRSPIRSTEWSAMSCRRSGRSTRS